MNTEIKKYNSGLSFTRFEDCYSRTTVVCRGYDEIIIANKSQTSSNESIRRYSLAEFKELINIFNNILYSRK